GGSAAASPGCRPRNPAVPAKVSPRRNLRRLHCLACWILMETSLPDPGQCDPETLASGLFFHRIMNRHSTSYKRSERGFDLMRHTSKIVVAWLTITKGGRSHETDRVWTKSPHA